MIVTNPLDGPDSGITFTSLIDRVQQILTSGDRENLNQLATFTGIDQTEITLKYPVKGIVAGSTLAIGLELMYVWDVSTTGVISVQRGYAGSEIREHAYQDVVVINPRFSRYSIGAAINDELRALSGKGLFQMKAVELTPNPITRGYDLGATDVIDVYEVTYAYPIGNDWVRVSGADYEIRHLADQSFASGTALFLNDVFYPGKPVRVLYKAGFGRLVDDEDDVQSDVGLHSEADDLLVLGAAIRLVVPLEIRRNQLSAQGDTRRPNEVPPGALARSSGGISMEYQQRLVEERHRLTRKFPLHLSRV